MATKKKQPITIAAQLYTLRRFLDSPEKLPGTFKKLKKAGYDAAQISGVCDIPAAELRKIMTDAGVKPIGAHIALARFRDDEFKKTMDDCHEWGIRYAAIPWLEAETFKTLDDWEKVFREFESIAKKAAKEGIIIQYHNHCFEFTKTGVQDGKGGKTLLDILYDSTTVLQSEIDFGWVARANQSPVHWAEKMKGRMDQVHFKDWGIDIWEPIWRALGEGGIDWPAVAKTCLQGGTHTFIVEQDECPATNDPFKSLEISRDYLRGFLG